MTTPAAPNPISLADVQAEFSGSNPISINEYYEGGTYVDEYTPAGQIPTSGTISLANFRGVSKVTEFIFNDTITASTTAGYSLTAEAQAAGWDQVVPLIATVTINAGVTVTGPSGFSGAFSTLRLSPYPAGSSLTVINNGTIAGLGGTGGAGGNANASSATAGGAGGSGYTGLYTYSIPTNMYNNGTIGGGGGGGGGGGAARATATQVVGKVTTGTFTWAHGGGGGGGGRSQGTPGGAGSSTGVNYPGFTNPGSAGTYTAAGAGGTVQNTETMVSGGTIRGGAGGAGGTLGSSGAAGQAGALTSPYDAGSVSGGGAGGAAGAAVQGGANIMWYAFGSRLGSIDNPGINMVPGGVVSGNTYEVSTSVLFPTTTTFSTIGFNSNGTSYETSTGVPDFFNTPNWYSPTTTSIGTTHWIRFTQVSSNGGTLSGDALNVWHSLSSSRQLTLSRTSTGFSTRSFTVQFATDAGGTTIVGSGTVILYANVDV